MSKTTCGYCGGKGWVLGRRYDGEGRAQQPPRIKCGECDGAGICWGGDEHQPAPEPVLDEEWQRDLARAGNPAWA